MVLLLPGGASAYDGAGDATLGTGLSIILRACYAQPGTVIRARVPIGLRAARVLTVLITWADVLITCRSRRGRRAKGRSRASALRSRSARDLAP
eukprot:1804077-Rhodomonas_salina.3